MEWSKVSNALDRSMYMFVRTLPKSICLVRRSTNCISIVNTSCCSMCSVCKCSWWWDVHICIYFVSSVGFVDFLIKSSFKKNKKKKTLSLTMEIILYYLYIQ